MAKKSVVATRNMSLRVTGEDMADLDHLVEDYPVVGKRHALALRALRMGLRVFDANPETMLYNTDVNRADKYDTYDHIGTDGVIVAVNKIAPAVEVASTTVHAPQKKPRRTP